MPARDRIIALLRTHPDGLDDDVIAEKLGLSRRQQANSRCRELEREGIIVTIEGFKPSDGWTAPAIGPSTWTLAHFVRL